MKKLILCLCVLACACGCDKQCNPLEGRRITQVDLFDVKLNRMTMLRSSAQIADITNNVSQLQHGWRRNWVTLPMNYWSLTFKEGTNSVGTLFVGADWMSYENMIRNSSPEEIQKLWKAAKPMEPAQQPAEELQNDPRKHGSF